MKFVSFIFVLFAGLSAAHAQNLCNSISCSAPQQAIQNDFNKMPMFSPVSWREVYSGSCFNSMAGIDPTHEHHGLLVLTPGYMGPMFSALFSFFSEGNPYAGMSYQQAFETAERGGSKPRDIELRPTDGYVKMGFDNGNIEYWMRTRGDDMYLLGFWNFERANAYFFCRLNRHH